MNERDEGREVVGHEKGEREKKITGNEANKLTGTMVTKYVRFSPIVGVHVLYFLFRRVARRSVTASFCVYCLFHSSRMLLSSHQLNICVQIGGTHVQMSTFYQSV